MRERKDNIGPVRVRELTAARRRGGQKTDAKQREARQSQTETGGPKAQRKSGKEPHGGEGSIICCSALYLIGSGDEETKEGDYKGRILSRPPSVSILPILILNQVRPNRGREPCPPML